MPGTLYDDLPLHELLSKVLQNAELTPSLHPMFGENLVTSIK